MDREEKSEVDKAFDEYYKNQEREREMCSDLLPPHYGPLKEYPMIPLTKLLKRRQ